MTYTLCIEIPGLPTITPNARQHWAAKAKQAKKWQADIAKLVAAQRPKKPLKRAKLVLTRFSSKSPDFDNLAASWKPLIDGLVYAKVLENDKYENIGAPEFKWEHAPNGKGKVRIEVMEVK